jgi:hypothetical protein
MTHINGAPIKRQPRTIPIVALVGNWYVVENVVVEAVVIDVTVVDIDVVLVVVIVVNVASVWRVGVFEK